MSHLCIIHSPDGAPWADYTTSKLLNQFPELKIASVPDERAFSNCTKNDPSIPESEVVILIASPNLVEYLSAHSDVVFNGTIDKCVKHCLVLLLGLEKEEMDEKADHFPAYEKWTHLTLTDNQEDLVVLFQRIIEIMQEIVNSRTLKQAGQQQQQQRRPTRGLKPAVRPKPKKQQCFEMAPGDELEVTNPSACNGQTTKSPKQPSESVPGRKPENQSEKTVSSQDPHANNATGNLSINITPSSPQIEKESGTIGAEEDSVYSRNLMFVKGTALIKTEQLSDNEEQPIQTSNGITVQPFAKASVRRETDTDDSIYENSEVQNSNLIKTGHSKGSDLNANLVTDTGMSTTDSPTEEFDDIDGPPTTPWDAPPAVAHRSRSGRVSDKDRKRFHKRSAAHLFSLSPAVIDGDDEREVLLVFERALRGDAELEVMLAGVPDHPPRTLHSIMLNPYNIKVIVPKLQPGRFQLRLVKKDITCGAQHLDVTSTNCEMIGLSQLYLTTLNLVCTSQGGGTPQRTDGDHHRSQRKISTTSTDSEDPGSPRKILDKHIIQLFENNDIPAQAFEKVFGIYEEFVQRNETMNGQLPSLLHFSARYGLCELTSRLIDLPGAREACNLKNRDGYKPVCLALLYKHTELADFLVQYSKTIDSREEIYARVRQFFERRTSRSSSQDGVAPGSSKSRMMRRQT